MFLKIFSVFKKFLGIFLVFPIVSKPEMEAQSNF